MKTNPVVEWKAKKNYDRLEKLRPFAIGFGSVLLVMAVAGLIVIMELISNSDPDLWTQKPSLIPKYVIMFMLAGAMGGSWIFIGIDLIDKFVFDEYWKMTPKEKMEINRLEAAARLRDK